MKRLLSLEKKYDAIKSKRDKLEYEIESLVDDTLAREKDESIKTHARFMREKLPPIMPYVAIAAHKTKPTVVRPTKRAKKGVKPPPLPLTLMDCFGIAEMATHVLSSFGPCELSVLLRVSKEMTTIVTRAVVILAPHYLAMYTDLSFIPEDKAKVFSKHKYEEDKAKVLSIVTSFANDERHIVNIGQLLSLFATFFYKYRGYTFKTPNKFDKHAPCHINWCLSDKTRGYSSRVIQSTPLSEMSVFVSFKIEEVTATIRKRWLDDHPLLGIAEMKEDVLNYANYDELSSLELKPVTDLFDPKKLIYINKHGLLSIHSIDRISRVWRVDGVTTFTANMSKPFFDLNERRTYIFGTDQKKKVEQLDQDIANLSDVFTTVPTNQ